MYDEKLLKQCFSDMKKYRGLYPYDGYIPCKGDGYFGVSITEKYDMDLVRYVSSILNEKEDKFQKYKVELFENLI